MAGKGTLTIKILGDASHLSREVGKSENLLSKIGGAAKLATAAAGVAVAGFAVKALGDFTKFQGQMNEVFTLLPGISGDAMSKMTGQVKGFSKEFGVLPDQVVPALYQALSAGVPQGNVFEFLETAQKAAKGGVTDLTTAVDGISSVVNAYGADVLNAAKASDLMFTAVRLGKTNFSELSASLFQVNPIAAALGVKFGDVTAALAAMTAQGVPTSVATTQLRGLFVELSKEGTKTSAVFKKVSGKSFKDFVSKGGNVQQALQLLEKHAQKTGVGINDLFGSVEAGGAALSLTGKGTDAFKGALAEMGKSAGATDAAFNQMQKGLGPVLDRIKANIAVFTLDVGEKLAPIAAKGLDLIGVAAAKVGEWWDRNGPAIIATATTIGAVLLEVGDKAKSAAEFIVRNWSTIKPILIGLAVFIGAVMVPHWVALGVQATIAAVKVKVAWVATKAKAAQAAVAHSAAVVKMVARWVLLGAQATIHAARVTGAWALSAGASMAKAVASTVAAVAVQVARWAFLGAQALAHAAKVAAAWLIAMGPIAIVAAAVAALVVVVIKNWDTIKKAIVGAAKAVIGWLSDNWPLILAILTGPIGLAVLAIVKHWGTIKDGFTAVKNWIGDRIGDIVSFFTGLPRRLTTAAGDLFGFVRSAATDATDWVRDKVTAIVDFFLGIPARIANVGKDILSKLIPDIPGAGLIGDALGAISGAIPGRAGGGPVSAFKPYIVGERGPELLVPRTAGMIVPNHALRGGSSGGTTTYNNNQVDVTINEKADPLLLARAVIWELG